ncbi:MAG: ribose-phosphate pyrophosphokinase [Chrysiogenetes bacterium]|nr:ribose-phosphate pyrophosphokinase [Chrysiogenetes bacterium]
MQVSKLKIFSGNANQALAHSICKYLGIPLGRTNIKRFSDGEIFVEIDENVRGMDVFIVQPTCPPVSDTLVELLIMMDAFKRASAETITVVIPYYGYARQDRKVQPRTPISSKLVADLLQTAGATRAVCMDLHAGQIQGFFDIPVDNLFATPVIIQYLQSQELDNLTVVSPDAGGAERARAFGKRLNAPFAMIDKRRPKANVAEVMHVIGDVDGRDCVIVDDMIDTAGTLTQAALALVEKGARSVRACATHGILSGPAIERINESKLTEVIVTDTIPHGEKTETCPKLKVLSTAELLGEAIRRIYYGESVSSLFV